MKKIFKRTILSDNNCIVWTRSDKPIDYSEALNYMENRVQEIIESSTEGLVWFLEHPAIYTMGASSDSNDLLDSTKLPVHKTSRGGQITYHGPGQRVVYIIADLKKIFYPQEPDLAKYVRLLEKTIIDFLFSIGVESQALTGNPGVWVKTKMDSFDKIAAIGIRVRKWVCFHGVSINISPDLDHFKGIIPCGIREHGVTSLDKLGHQMSIKEFDSAFSKILENNLKDASII